MIQGISKEEWDLLSEETKANLTRMANNGHGTNGKLVLKATPIREENGELKGGCVQIRGLRGANVKFGFNVYPATLEDLFSHREEIEAWIGANKASLSYK